MSCRDDRRAREKARWDGHCEGFYTDKTKDDCPHSRFTRPNVRNGWLRGFDFGRAAKLAKEREKKNDA